MAKRRYNVAAIMDDFDYYCFKPECNLIHLNPDNWQKVLMSSKLDLFILGAIWRGLQNSWHKKFDYSASRDNPLIKVIDFCKRHSIPTVFYAKEDPMFFRKYLNLATACDYIFTTAGECISEYKKVIGHQKVYLLPFAVQPRIHNPVGRLHDHKKNVGFAGSWFHFPERKQDMKMLFDQALKYGLEIYSRNNRNFPPEYRAGQKPGVTYLQTADVYKNYHVFLNINTIKDSSTMFARRALEALACGTCLVSNYSRGMENLLGREVVQLCSSGKEVEQALAKLLNDGELRERLSLLGQRKVFSRHNMTQRFNLILEKLGLQKQQESKRVTVMVNVRDKENLKNIIDNFNRQDYANKELYVICDKRVKLPTWVKKYKQNQNIVINQLNMVQSPGQLLNHAVRHTKGEYIARFIEQDYYARSYLSDLLNTFLYAKTPLVGKVSHYIWLKNTGKLLLYKPGYEYSYASYVYRGAYIGKREVFKQVRYQPLENPDTPFYRECHDQGFDFYIVDRFNYVRVISASEDLRSTFSKSRIIKPAKDIWAEITV